METGPRRAHHEDPGERGGSLTPVSGLPRSNVQILVGDVRAVLRTLPTAYFDCVVTSPPYWGLRSYLADGDPQKQYEIGLEPTLGQHIDVLVGVFREIWRVLKPHGTVWLNYGDCYAAAPNGKSAAAYKADGTDDRTFRDKPFSTVGAIYDPAGGASGGGVRGGNKGNTGGTTRGRVVAGGFLKPKDLCMIPNRLAIALQDDGWWVRSEIIWHKPNPMPESVYDRPTTSHEKVWLLTKAEDYFYNHEAIREPVTGGAHDRAAGQGKRDNGVGWDLAPGAHGKINRAGRTEATYRDAPGVTPKSAPEDSNIKSKGSFNAALSRGRTTTRNARNVWTITPHGFREAHFATFPPALAERCIKAGVPATTCALCGEAKEPANCGGMCRGLAPVPGRVLDPFGGSGTVGLVAKRLGVDATLIELNAEYAAMAERRIQSEEGSL